MTSILWFRRDLRLSDNPALLRASDDGDVLPVFVFDPALTAGGGRRLRRLRASLAALHDLMDGALVARTGSPDEVIPQLAREIVADTVHIHAETTPYGRLRDRAVARALEEDGRELVATGSPYAIGPGLVRKGDGTPFKVFTPFSKAWRDHGWPAPAPTPEVTWVAGVGSEAVSVTGVDDGEAGERAALRRWREFRDEHLDDYADKRNRPDLDTTSRLSIPLKYGEIHPRTILADLAGRTRSRFVTELAWREFYADVLFHNPRSAWQDLRPLGISYDDPQSSADLVEAWKKGETGFPIVDAGMRQLRHEGWMHNRVRMITASFFTKDLHQWWPVGARYFLDQLQDGDLASNNHGWQWVAGTGTDAAPYFRVFNPTLQGEKFDPGGDYVRRWVPELAHLPGKEVHQPWKADRGYDHGYPHPIVNHDDERRESLRRYQASRDTEGGSR